MTGWVSVMAICLPVPHCYSLLTAAAAAASVHVSLFLCPLQEAAALGPALTEPFTPLPALSVAHEEEPLIRKILTEQQFGSHVAEVRSRAG